MNKLYVLDVEMMLAQKQDLYMYFTNLKGIKKNKPEIEEQFVDHDLKEALKQVDGQPIEYDLSTMVTLEQFKTFTKLQMERFSRMTEFEFIYPDFKIVKKYELLKKVAQTFGTDYVSVNAIKEYQEEKAKPYYHDEDDDNANLDDQQRINAQAQVNDEENTQLISQPKSTIIEISQVKDVFERIMDSRLDHYKKKVEKGNKEMD